MTELDEEGFLNKLYEVVHKLASISKTQSYRFKKEWDQYLYQFNEKPYLLTQIQVEKDKFLNDINYRIKVLEEVRLSFESGYHSIKTLLTTLYGNYFNDSKQFEEDFSKKDQVILKYLIAKKILGDLIQYNQLDHESVPLKYNLIARNYLMMKLKGLTEHQVIENIEKIGFKVTSQKLRKIFKEIIKDGIIKKKKKGWYIYYIADKEIELSETGNKKYIQIFRTIIEWPTLFWRSFYNIRELNVTIKGNSKHSDFLNKILEKAATQGYVASHYVFTNLISYYKKLKNA